MLRSTQVSSFLAKISSIRKPASTIQYQSKRNVFFSFEPKELAEENKKNNAWREFENNLEENFSSYEGINDKVYHIPRSQFLRQRKGRAVARRSSQKVAAWRDLLRYSESQKPSAKDDSEKTNHHGLKNISEFCKQNYAEISKDPMHQYVANIAIFGEKEADKMLQERKMMDKLKAELDATKKLHLKLILKENRKLLKDYGVIIDEKGNILEGKDQIDECANFDESILTDLQVKLSNSEDDESEAEAALNQALKDLGLEDNSKQTGSSASSTLKFAGPGWRDRFLDSEKRSRTASSKTTAADKKEVKTSTKPKVDDDSESISDGSEITDDERVPDVSEDDEKYIRSFRDEFIDSLRKLQFQKK